MRKQNRRTSRRFRHFALEFAPGQYGMVNGDPDMPAETRQALAEMMRLAYAQAVARMAAPADTEDNHARP